MSPYALLCIMSTFFCIINAESNNVNSSDLIPCKQGWFLYDSKCYKILGESKGLNWKEASFNCSLEGGTLATIHSQELQEFIVMFLLLAVQKNAWIGLHDRVTESEFTWDDRSPLNYTNWDANQPTGTGSSNEKEDCVEMLFQNWKKGLGSWNDVSCDTKQPYVCQADESEDVLSEDPRLCSVDEGEGWKYLNSCYHVVTEAMSWENAENYCQEKYSGHLVAISDDKTEIFLNYLFSDYTENFWIGIKMRDLNVQVWSSGLHVTYKNWDGEQKHFLPGTCSMMSKINLWEIGPCFRELPFICEKSSNIVPVLKKAPEGWHCPVTSKEWIDLGGEYCYIFETSKSLKWNEAHYECVRKGGSLASIHSEAESYAIHPHVEGTQERILIGLHRSLSNKDIFEWGDGTKLDYLNWNAGEPNYKQEECGEIWTHSMKWNDIPCDKSKGFICSAKKVPPYTPKLDASVPNECVCNKTSNLTDHKGGNSTSEAMHSCPVPPHTPKLNASVPNECVCNKTSNLTDHKGGNSTSEAMHSCPDDMSSKTVAVILLSILLVVVLAGVIVYNYRYICKRRNDDFIHREYSPPSLNHLSSDIILKEEF